jgi:hypothetical protein
MEHGFFHPLRGYWQTVDDVSADTLSTYPEGTVEVPLKPGASYEWSGKNWVFVPPPAPTPEEIQARMRAARAAAYAAEADPLFFKWQAGESTQADWLAKRAEIRARYPYPDEAQ